MPEVDGIGGHLPVSGHSPASGPEAGDRPGPLVSVAWLAAHLDDPDLRLVHVSPERDTYADHHIPGAAFSELHEELALRGTAPETGDAPREWLIPDAQHLSATLHRWGVGPGDRVVLYDDVGRNRQAIRGYWLLRYYGWPHGRVHVLDGGLPAWQRAGQPTTADAPPDRHPAPVPLSLPDPELIATYEDVLAWSRESASGGPIRILDVRTPEEHRGEDVRTRRGGHIPGAVNLPFDDFLTDEDTFRPLDEIRRLTTDAAGGDPTSLRAAHCQGGVRAALAWFALHELLGLEDFRNYAGSWEEWGNRPDAPIEAGAGATGRR